MIEGGCNCGGVRYAITGEPIAVAACHCTRCRRQSGSAFSVNLVVKTSDMTVTGQLTAFEDTETGSGAPVMREFCAVCGSPIRSRLTANPRIIAVKAGTLDEPGSFAPGLHVWTQSRLPWVEIPAGLPQFAQNAG